jgi:hypothetical protein
MAFYRKNISSMHQVIRLVIGIAAVIASLVFLSGWPTLLVAAGGIGFALTGIVGYCPMCAMVGIDRRKSS